MWHEQKSVNRAAGKALGGMMEANWKMEANSKVWTEPPQDAGDMARDRSEVERGLDELRRNVDVLHKGLDVLEGRLAMVLRPADVETQSTGAVLTWFSQLGVEIGTQADGVHAANERVLRLLGRLAI